MDIETSYQHIVLNDANDPTIAGTTMKVIELVLNSRTYGWSPEELKFQHPFLTMAQIHSALAYYWDHQEELDEDIEQRFQLAESLRKTRHLTPFEERLKRQCRYGNETIHGS